ncbi:hypothetical protein FPV67DRAFT_1492030 [Lyophyllum atratum]|nr:hypothetical protein FPV67DRAFT_1492030 [Lyophyllum atratum]
MPSSSTIGTTTSRIGHQDSKAPRAKAEDHQRDRVAEINEPPAIQLAATFALLNSGSASGNESAASIHHQNIEAAIHGFAESAQIGLDVLSELASIHPFIYAPVMAFKLVIILDLKRRENNSKVLAVKVQMQSMMTVLFQLRNIQDPNEIGPDGLSLPGRLQNLMLEIADSIKECASACDLYMKKSLIRKYLKSPIYEARLASYAAQFAEFKAELEHALAIHTALGVDTANQKLDVQTAHLRDLQSQMRALFLRLDTPREAEIRTIIQDNGGPKASIIDNNVLQALLDKSGEDISKFAGRLEGNLQEMRQSLSNELAEDVDKAFAQNLALFEGKLDIQKREIDDAITRQGDRIIEFFSGGHERIIDPQLREIWKEMGWKSTVKARHFVLALRDYFLEERSLHGPRYGHSSVSTVTSPNQLTSPSLSSPPAEPPHHDLSGPPAHCNNEEWANAYVNVSYLQAIAESIDDDGSGFINIKEVNEFTNMRPKGWTLLQWLAYWAAGWHSSISEYSTKIYKLMRKIYNLREKVRPDNRRMLDAYLDKPVLYRLELLLRSTKTVTSEGTLITAELAQLRDEFCEVEEKRIDDNMEKIGYNIDSTDTVSLLTGSGRIERYIYPVIYLLLKRQLKTIQLARNHILHLDEMFDGYSSLVYVFAVFDMRLQDLSATFQQMHINIDAQLENFAFGMFKTSYGSVPWRIQGNTLSAVWDNLPTEPGEDDDVITCPEDIPLSLLKYGVQEPFTFPVLAPFTTIAQPEDSPNILQGAWAGYCMWKQRDEYGSHDGLFRILFAGAINDDGTTSGTADGYIGRLDMTYLLTSGEDGKNKVDFVMAYEDGYWLRCQGTLNTTAGTISGGWYCPDYASELKPIPGSDAADRQDGNFQLSRTPAPLVRFRYSQAAFAENPVRARWFFACAAVLRGVQRDRLSKDYVMSRLRDGRRFKALVIKQLIEINGYSRRNDFTQEERAELRTLENTMCPTVDQFYYSMAGFVVNRQTFHLGVACDGPGCKRKILQSRLLCIVCIDESLTASLDFCFNCKDKELPDHATHTASHSLIRGDRFIHDSERVWMTPKARAMSERLKTVFRTRAMESKEGRTDAKRADAHERARNQSENTMKCAFCEKEISPPCWVCLECPGDSFVCDNCDEVHQLPPAPENMVTTPASMVHAMLRIKDDKPVEIPDDDPLARVEKRLTGVKRNVEERLDNLDKQLTRRTMALEAILTDHIRRLDQMEEGKSLSTTVEPNMEQRFGDLEVKVERRLDSLEARFTSMEELLREFLDRVSVPRT